MIAADSPRFDADGPPSSLPLLQPVSPGPMDETTGRLTRQSRSVHVKTTTFGDISIPPRFIINVGHSFRGRLYVNIVYTTIKITSEFKNVSVMVGVVELGINDRR